jgi:hypothetical protein
MRKLAFLTAVIFIGFQVKPLTEAYHRYRGVYDRFVGVVAPKPQGRDITGIWDVRLIDDDGKPWAVKWMLKHRSGNGWEDENGLGTVTLHQDSLVWDSPKGRWPYRIEQQSFGFFLLIGHDEKRYLAVRLEGGEK